MKHCLRCDEDLPLSAFGRNAANETRGARDGKNILCKQCIREKTAAHRASLREYRARVPRRKPCLNSIPIWRMKISPVGKVKVAFARGITDRLEIRKATRLYLDELTDIIAELNDVGELKWNRNARRFQLAA